MTKHYHITPEQTLRIWEDTIRNLKGDENIYQAFANAVLDEVLGEPVAEVEVRKNRILTETLMQVTTPIADGRHKLYTPKEQS